MQRFLSVFLTLALIVGLFPTVVLTPATAQEALSLSWSQGTHYGTPNTSITSRKYTVIPCEEGDIYHLDFPSEDWAVYVHFADAQGDFGLEYLYRSGKPLDVVVREMDGRVPTELRLTTFHRSDDNVTITEDLWATFDVTVHKSTVVKGDLLHNAAWNQGTPANPSTDLRKYTTIPCQVGDVFRFGFISTYWDVYVLPADENGPLTDDDTYFSKDGTYTVEAVDGKEPTSIVVVAVPDPQGTTITDEIWNSFCVSCVKESSTFTFATQNFGLWNDGMTQGVSADKVDARAEAWQQEMAEHDIDILVGQEWLPYLDSDKTVDANNKVFGSMYPYMYGNSTATYDGKNIISRTPLTDITYNTMVSNVGRRYAKAYTTIDGKTVCIINAHLSFVEDINTYRKKEIVELLNIAQAEPYVIIAGDFNVFTPDEFQIFEEAGYSLANAGEFGEFNTWPNFGKNPTSDANRVLDNIIVSPGIRINSVQVDDHQLSDHAMLVAELELLEEDTFTDERLLCEHCNQFVEWTPWTLTNGGSANAIRDSGHYYLTQDLTGVTEAFRIGVNGEATPDVVVDLRGHAVKSTARSFYMRQNSKLSIVDTVGCGTITSSCASTGGIVYIEKGSTLSLYDGTLYATDTTTAKKGGAIYAESGSFVNVCGGELHGGYASDGGAIYASSSNIKITGGTINGSTATNSGGAIYINNGTLNMTGGTITGGTANSDDSGNCVYVTSGGSLTLSGDADVDEICFGGDSAETLTVSGAYTGTTALRLSVAAEANKVIGISDSANLDGASISVVGSDLIVKTSGTDLVLFDTACGAIIKDAEGNEVTFASVGEAIEKYQGTDETLVLMGDVNESGLTISKDMTIDLNGSTIEQEITIADGVTLTCMDSQTKDYDVTDGTFTQIPASMAGATVAADGYVKYTHEDDNTVSFHKIDTAVESLSVRPAKAGMYYGGTFKGDQYVAEQVKTFGVALSITEAPVAGTDGFPSHCLYSAFTKDLFEPGNTEEYTSTILVDILSENNGTITNKKNGATDVYGVSYIQLNDGTYIYGNQVSYSLQWAMEWTNDNWKNQSDDIKEAVFDLIDKFPAVLNAWDIPDIIAAYKASR